MEAHLTGRGHPEVRAAHRSTLEVTTENYLTSSGDCIIAVDMDGAPASFDPVFVAACRDASARIRARIKVDQHALTVEGWGDPELRCSSETSAVIRTSEYIDDRTVMTRADTAAADLPRDLVACLVDGAPLELTLSVHT